MHVAYGDWGIVCIPNEHFFFFPVSLEWVLHNWPWTSRCSCVLLGVIYGLLREKSSLILFVKIINIFHIVSYIHICSCLCLYVYICMYISSLYIMLSCLYLRRYVSLLNFLFVTQSRKNQMTDGDQIWQDGSFYPGDGFKLVFVIVPFARMP